MRKIFILLASFAVLASCQDKNDNSYFIPGYDSEQHETPVDEKGSDVSDDIVMDKIDVNHIKVMSFNVRVGTSADGENSWDNRKFASADLIYKENPVVFGVQEALQSQLVYLRQQCPSYKDIGVGREDGRNGGEHMSIFYNTKRVELIDWGTFWLSDTPDEPSNGWGETYKRSATWAFFHDKGNGIKFFYVNTHGPLNTTANLKAMGLLSQMMRSLNKDDLPSILTADFNIGPDSPNFAPIRAYMYNARETAPETDNYSTFNGFASSTGSDTNIIDHIWYSGFTPLSYRTIRDSYKGIPYVSDHYPIVALLKVEE